MGFLGNAFTSASFVDGVIMKADLKGVDVRQHFVSTLREELLKSLPGISERDFIRGFKPQMFYMDRERYRCIVKVQLTGDVARAAEHLRAGYIALVTGVHVKAGVFSLNEDWDLALSEALYKSANAGQQLTLFKEKVLEHDEKGTGRGWRIGDRNADYHFASYKRRGQRVGIEVRVQDRPILRLRAECVELAAEHNLNDKNAWRLLFRKAAKVGADRFDRDLSLKGIEPLAFFSGFTEDISLFSNPVTYYSVTNGRPYIIDLETGEIEEGVEVQ